MAKIENHKYTIEEAFRECFYVIPDYQREYVWTEKEVQQLLEDIDEQIGSGSAKEYFIGTILVSPAGERNHFEVIDGQQRLTTLYLLLCALRNRFGAEPQATTLEGLLETRYTDSNGNSIPCHKLEPRYDSAGQVIGKLVALNTNSEAARAAIAASGIPSFGSLENLVDAYDTVYKYLQDNYADLPSLKRYWGYLANNVIFIQISTDISSALKIFETINERGIGLNPMDLLKNLLFTHVPPNKFTELKDYWKKVTNPLEKANEKPLRFLRYFLMANYAIRNERSDSVVREDEIYDWFVKPENADACGYKSDPFGFVRKIIRNVEQYIHFIEGYGNDGKQNLAMDSLKRLCGGAFSLHHVLLLAASGLPKQLFDHFVTQLESFLFFYIFTKTPTKELERSFSVWADELREIASITDQNKHIASLNAFVEERFVKGMVAKEAELSDALKRYTLNSMQQYRTRYLLAKLTQHVDMAYKGLKTPGPLGDYTNLEIEHILPNRPKADLKDAFAASSPGCSYDDCKIKLGNLALLEKPINIVAGNDFFAGKKTEYEKSKHYLTSSISTLTNVGQNTSITRINEKLRSFSTWTGKDIDDRHDILRDLAKDIWKTHPL